MLKVNNVSVNNHFNRIVAKEGTGLSCLRWLIAFFFIATPFNPSIDDTTIYLWLPMICCDKEFVLKLIERINLKYVLLLFLWLTSCLLSLKFNLTIKCFSICLGVAYIFFIGEAIIKKIYACFLFSAIFCIIQFVTYFYSPVLANSLGPEQMSLALWGEYATLTFTNQYVLFLFPRMSGLSREAGFFVSLLCIVFLIRKQYGKMTFVENVIFLLGFLFSLSKISILGLLLPILFLFKNFINKIPVFLTFLVLFLVYCYIAVYLNIGSTNYFYDNESIAHRFSAAYLVFNMQEKYLLTGCPVDFNCFNSESMALVDYLVNERHLYPSIGFIGLILDFGLFGIILICFSVVILKLDSFKFFILVLFTSTVYILTVDNFIILLYYYLIMLDSKEK